MGISRVEGVLTLYKINLVVSMNDENYTNFIWKNILLEGKV